MSIFFPKNPSPLGGFQGKILAFQKWFVLLEIMKYKFKSLRVKGDKKSFNQPDYSNFITINKTDFTLIGYLGAANSDITYTLEKVTQERLNANKYFRSEYLAFKGFPQ